MRLRNVFAGDFKEVNPAGIVLSASGLFKLFTALVIGLSFYSCSENSGPAYEAGTHNIPVQRFIVNSSENEVISGQNGSIYAIPAGAFMDSMGNTISGPIEFRLQEASRDIEILGGDLVTMTGSNLLASDGMYKIEAFQDGKGLVLNPSVGIYAYFPTSKKVPGMNLYVGEFNESKLDWKLSGEGELTLPMCDKDKESRKKCKRCERLVKMGKNIKTGDKPDKDEYWVKRHYWENGVLYFASSGSNKPIMSQEQIKECESYLKLSEAGQELLAKVDQIKKEQLDEIGDFYSFRLQSMGWFNCDRLVKEDVIAFTGKITDDNGEPVEGAQVHLYCKKPDLRVHTSTTAADGTFKLSFIPGEEFQVYAFQKDKVGKVNITLRKADEDIGSLAIGRLEDGRIDQFLSDLM